MHRYKLTVEYDGTNLCGWQIQRSCLSVQGLLTEAIEAFCRHSVSVAGAGRTDSGVHALGQVAHCDLQRFWPASTVRDAVNYYLRHQAFKPQIAVAGVEEVAPDFDARFSATTRHYLYRVYNRPVYSVLEAKRVWHVGSLLDVSAMSRAVRHLIGNHDFTTFRAAACQAQSPIKTLDTASVSRGAHDPYAVEFRFSARSFLHRQVRSMVGSLVQVGLGRWTDDDLAEALGACDRSRCGSVAPAHGLYLQAVEYPRCTATM